MKSTITFELRIKSNSDDISEMLLYVEKHMEKPERVLIKNQKRVLLNGKTQRFLNKDNEILFSHVHNGKRLTDFLKKEINFLEKQKKHFLYLKNLYDINMYLRISIRTDFSSVKPMMITAEQMQLLVDLGIYIDMDFLTKDKNS